MSKTSHIIINERTLKENCLNSRGRAKKDDNFNYKIDGQRKIS